MKLLRGGFAKRVMPGDEAGRVSVGVGWHFGLGAMCVLAAVFGALMPSILPIPGSAIDHDCVRGLGMSAPPSDDRHASGPSILFHIRPLPLPAAPAHPISPRKRRDAAAIVETHRGDPGAFAAKIIVIAPRVMVAAAWSAPRLILRCRYWRVMLVAVFRAAGTRHGRRGAAECVGCGARAGAGLQSVVVPAPTVRLRQSSGRINVGRGVVMTVQASAPRPVPHWAAAGAAFAIRDRVLRIGCRVDGLTRPLARFPARMPHGSCTWPERRDCAM
ncbi:hypothetical protein [Burkholderia anthina]|uniref:hypothetical protein n=1 Tax=Burkholderia anthina TaxID=179879 RepID=UPI00158D1567|nr:hypothetical protein [Burkholderia anthina]